MDTFKYKPGFKLIVDEEGIKELLTRALNGLIEQGCEVQNVTSQSGKLFQISFGEAREVNEGIPNAN